MSENSKDALKALAAITLIVAVVVFLESHFHVNAFPVTAPQLSVWEILWLTSTPGRFR